MMAKSGAAADAAAAADSEKPAAVIAGEAAAQAEFEKKGGAAPDADGLTLEPDPELAPVKLAVPRDCGSISHEGREYPAKNGRILVPGKIASALVASGHAKFVPASDDPDPFDSK